MELSPISPRLQLQYSTPAAQPSKAVARVAPANLSGSASRIRLSSSTGSKSRGFMRDSPARSPVVSRFTPLQNNVAPVPAAAAIGAGGRIGKVKRVTKETNVSVKINLDGTGDADSSTSTPFLDHMLDQLASHGLFDVHVRATGDTHIDDHHTNEDVALAIGTAFLQALGDSKGIQRFGDFSAPLDEALIHVALDLSGRPHLSFDLQIPTQRLGMYDTQHLKIRESARERKQKMADGQLQELPEELDEVLTEISALGRRLGNARRALLRHIWEGNVPRADAARVRAQLIQDELGQAIKMRNQLIIQMTHLRG